MTFFVTSKLRRAHPESPFAPLLLVLMFTLNVCVAEVAAQTRPRSSASSRRAGGSRVGAGDLILVRILAAEDTRRWTPDVARLLDAPAATTRARAALAAGRIGDPLAVSALIARLRTDADERVRSMAAFALGEIESADAAAALIETLNSNAAPSIRSRAVEALGKTAAAMPDPEQIRRDGIGDAILRSLDRAARGTRPTARPDRNVNRKGIASSRPDDDFVLAALTAVLRARPAAALASVRAFLLSPNADVRATALNTLARLRTQDANDAARPLLADSDSVVRANAARVLGAGKDRASLATLAARAAGDADARVRVSAIRALAAIDDKSSGVALRERFSILARQTRTAPPNSPPNAAQVAASSETFTPPAEQSELLEIAAALGTLLSNSDDAAVMNDLRRLRDSLGARAPEVEIALARISPAGYVRDEHVIRVTESPARASWHQAAAVAEALSEVARHTSGAITSGGNAAVVVRADASIRLRQMLDAGALHESARPAVLRSLALFDPPDLLTTLVSQLKIADVYTRAAAAELLGDRAARERDPARTATAQAASTAQANDAAGGNAENNAITSALILALTPALADAEPDAALAILVALARHPSRRATGVIESALSAPDPLVRRRAAALLRARSGGAEVATRTDTSATQFTAADYTRAIARRTKRVHAEVTIDRGAFAIELLPSDAPLTVDNFVRLAARNYFDGQEFHRVVPNFVAQTGDPRGDGNGGPGYTIRCEINTVPYLRGSVGMALSGKDTGGSQWFATHSPQPHLDGGYTVFGRVVEGMEIVDSITRGDRIRRIRIIETSRPAPARGRRFAARSGARR